MKLSITATLTEEEVIILAQEKWWSPTVTETKEKIEEWVFAWYETIEISNPITAEQFIVNVYQSMIVQDATKVFTEYRTQELKQQIAQTENIVTEQVTQAITSSIENV